MKELQRHSSPDGLLQLLVVEGTAGDITIGFEGFPWHTHGDILTDHFVIDGNEPLATFIREVTSGERIIGILRKEGEISDAWVLDSYSQVEDDKHRESNESLEFRLWDGTIVAEFALKRIP